MDVVSIGLIASAACAVFFSMLFTYEERTGKKRVLGTVRSAADRGVLYSGDVIRSLGQYIGRDFIRQLFHYTFHTFLRFMLRGVERLEQRVRSAMRINKNLARTVERESASRTKLEEIALHKSANALTDTERRAHKERALRGM